MLSLMFSNPISLIFLVIGLLVAITVHEFAHAWMADRLGDPTARLKGRISFNPFRHLDVIGMLFILFIGFGWGKPVPVDPYNLKNPKKDHAIISFAGPASNLILAILLSILLRLFTIFDLNILSAIGYAIIRLTIEINVGLAVFNLLPIYPLDGYNIVGGLLPDKQVREWQQLARYGYIFLLFLILPLGNNSMLDFIIRPVVDSILRLLVISPIPGMGIV